MATIEKTDRKPLAEAKSKVRHPLAAIRGYIRSYVTLEGVAFFLIFLFLWFWIGLLLDYGFLHKLLGVDYVRWLPSSSTGGKVFRSVILGGLLAFLAAKLIFMVAVRLFRDFSDSSLALLLERRYPKELGDRLITAVELSDPEKAAMQGYSVAMIEETIQEAGERVGKVPVRGIFDWGRLMLRGVAILGLSVVGYFLAVGLFAWAKPYQTNRATLGGMGRFHDVSAIWFERNILLQDTPWPRDVQLVQLQPDTDTVRMGSNLGRAVIKYRALKYVIADANIPEGWRPLLVKDLQDDRAKLITGEIPTPPGDWKGKYNPEGDLSLDEVEVLYNRLPIKMGDLAGRWTVRELSESGNVYRPLLWSDLVALPPVVLGAPVRKLDVSWDPSAVPAQVAGVVGVYLGQLGGLRPLGSDLFAAASVAQGPILTPNLTVDQVEEKLKAPEPGTDPELLTDLRAVFDRLERLDSMRQLVERAPEDLNRAPLSRTARILNLPQAIEFFSSVKNSETRVELNRSRETNEFTNQLDLPTRTETLSYYARAGDYYTPTRVIEVIGPPQLLYLMTEEEQPAYLFYRWGEETRDRDGNVTYKPEVRPDDLVGLKQKVKSQDRLNAGASVSRIEIPAGASLTLQCYAERKLKSIAVTPGKGGKLPEKIPISEGTEVSFNETEGAAGKQVAFSSPPAFGERVAWKYLIELPGMKADNYALAIEMLDEDNVKGSRNVVVRVLEDNPPDLPDIKPSEILRKNKDGAYLVTPDARVPFVGQILDDRGISSVRYAYTVEPIELIPKLNAGVLGLYLGAFASGGIRGQVAMTALPTYLQALTLNTTDEADRIARIKVVRTPSIAGLMEAIKSAKSIEKEPYLTLADIKSRLGQSQVMPYRPMTTKYNMTPDVWDEGRSRFTPEKNDFAMLEARMNGAKLKVDGDPINQPSFKMTIWVEGVDTDVEGSMVEGRPQPHVTLSKDRYPFRIVPEYELLLEINKSEEALNFRLIQLSRESGKSWEGDSMTKMENDLGENLVQLAGNTVKVPEVRQMSSRIRLMKELLVKGQLFTQDVLADYRLLMLEMETNRITEDRMIEKRKDVVRPLEKIVGDGGSFQQAQRAMETFQIALENASKGEDPVPAPMALTNARKTGDEAQAALRKVHGDLEAVIQALEQVANLAKEIEKLKKIADKTLAEQQLFARLKKLREDQDFENALNPTPMKKP